MIRVLVVDDDALLRQGVRVVLDSADGIHVVGEAADGLEAVTRAADLRPDVVLMDVRMPGIEATRRVTAASADVKVLVLTTFRHDEYVWGALRAGASGFLLKRTAPEQLIEAVRTIAAGESLLDPAVTRDLVNHFVVNGGTAAHAEDRALLALLTRRETDVLRLIARGLSNAEIGADLVIAESTAKTHVKRVIAKLGARDRAQAVVVAYRSGLAR